MNREYLTSTYKIAVIGLGYVGLPLSVAFGKEYHVTGFDINVVRVKELTDGFDRTKEIAEQDIKAALHLRFTDKAQDLQDCNVFIITVPTPLDDRKKPDLQFLLHASELVGKLLSKGDIVIYESTVYPGCTEEDCVPVLNKASGLVFNQDFFCGYSPERINPGDKKRTLTNIKKVTTGSTPAIADIVDALYKSIITAGTHKAPSIKVAEAAKAIENAQRDVNISFMNELALIFDRMGIDTNDVIEAAATKWNFLPFRPGLVGGHCISVDPHYLAYKAIELGYQPAVILSGRKVNEGMGIFVAEKTIALLAAKKKGAISSCRVLILGISFKENCMDTRNTKVVDIYRTLEQAGIEPSIYDPRADSRQVFDEYGISLLETVRYDFDGVILAVDHDAFRGIDFEQFKKNGAVIFDTQSFVRRDLVDARL